MDDDGSDVCLQCSSAFSLLVRRHHCRSCGGLFCSSCCSHWIAIPEEMTALPPYSMFRDPDQNAPSRCCTSCVALIRGLDRQSQTDVISSATGNSSPQHRNDMSSPSREPAGDETSARLEPPPSQPSSAMPTDSLASPPLVPREEAAATSPSPSPLRQVACQEWRGGTVGAGKHKLYAVTVPSSIPRGRVFQVSLDNRVMTVHLPSDIAPGQRILVKAPSPPMIIQRAQASAVLPPTKKVPPDTHHALLQ